MNEDRMDDDALWLDAGLDGELDTARSLALDRRLASDPAFRARWEARRALRGAVRGAASYHELPPALRARVEAALEGAAAPAVAEREPRASSRPIPPAASASPSATDETSRASERPRAGVADAGTARASTRAVRPARAPLRAWTWPWMLASGAGGACAAALLTALVLERGGMHGLRESGVQAIALAPGGGDGAPAGLAAEAVSAHTRALLVGETIEVASSDRHTVRPWLAARLNFVPAIEDFSAQGYALAGARRDVIGGETAAALVYRHGAHVISVFVRPLRERGPAGSDGAAPSERPPTLRTVRGFNVVEMTHAGMAYSLVSDMNIEEMGELAQLLRRTGG